MQQQKYKHHQTTRFLKNAALLFVVLALGACKGRLDVADYSHLSGRAECVGRHSFIVPTGAELRWTSENIDLNRLTIVPSDGRSAAAQADRNRTGQDITRAVLNARLGQWNYAVYEVADSQHPLRYEIASTIVQDTLILTESDHSKSRVPQPRSILSDRIHNTLTVSPGVGDFCVQGLGFSGHAPSHFESVGIALRAPDWSASLHLVYFGPNLEPLPVSEPPGLPAGTVGISRRKVAIERRGQAGFLDIVWGDDRPGVELKAELPGLQRQPDAPEITLSISMAQGSADDAQALALALLAGLMER